MCVPPSLTVCQRSGQTQDSRSPSELRLCPLDQSASGTSLLQVRAAGWMVIMVHAALVPARGPGATPPGRESFQPASGGRAVGLQRGVRASGRRDSVVLPGSATPPPRPPPRALSVPGAEPGPEARVRVRTLAGSPLCAGTLPSGPPQPLDLSAQGTISQMRGLGCTGAG